jgi:multidrug resistance efflux pump
LKSLEQGIFINIDGRTDVPYQQQRIDDISMRQHDLSSKIQEAEIREAALKKACLLEEARFKKMSEATIKAPFNGVAWRVFGAKGSHVDTTKPILEMVDCSNVFVDTSIHERYFSKIKPGDPATIRLVGDKRTLKGIVQSVRGGSLSESSTAFLAGATQVLRPHEIQVMIKINEADVNAGGPGDFCFMGRTGEVSFDNMKLF